MTILIFGYYLVLMVCVLTYNNNKTIKYFENLKRKLFY